MKRFDATLRVFIPRLKIAKGDDICTRIINRYGNSMPVYGGVPGCKGETHWDNFKIVGNWLTADLCVEDDSFTGYSNDHKIVGRVVQHTASNWDHICGFEVINISTSVPFTPGELICPEWIRDLTVNDLAAIIKKYNVPDVHARNTAEYIKSNENAGIFIDGDYNPYPILVNGTTRSQCNVVSSKRVEAAVANARVDQLTIGDFKQKYRNLQTRRSTLVSEISDIDKELDRLRAIVEVMLK